MNILKDLWDDKPLLLVVIAAAAFLLYLTYKSNPGNQTVTNQPQPGNIGNTATYPEGQIQVINPAPVSIITMPAPAPGATTIINQLPTPPPAQKGPLAPTYGFLGPGAVIAGDTYRLPNGQTGSVAQILSGQGYPGTIRYGSQGRIWDIFNNMKYLITSGQGGIVTNSGTNANA